MKQQPAYEDAIDLLDADHKLVKKLFIDFGALVEDDAPPQFKQLVAAKICRELTIHAQVEEEIFYPAVREAIGDEALMDEAEAEHAQAKELIAKIEGMEADDEGFDDAVKSLGEMIDEHVHEEREQIFLKAKYADLDLRGMVPDLVARKKALQPGKPAPSRAKKTTRASAKKEHA
ncbi:hemerythrin domain-containing protein [Caenimonas aquaedulcis]|uniref:Hemerythrin domain-containing protein n=1 Tax=Caenimonas aquaedulcis TaxID=2793270 RepID=A0A931H8F3_9BURK|nr:hemerythrin domain-containing protein [Caenimonas aquaedulcis]MBG9390636.1 hemerythrin domain-containing protein [Caenimonas aquaedulcis]